MSNVKENQKISPTYVGKRKKYTNILTPKTPITFMSFKITKYQCALSRIIPVVKSFVCNNSRASGDFQKTHTAMRPLTAETSPNIHQNHNHHDLGMTDSHEKQDWPPDHPQMQGQSNLNQSVNTRESEGLGNLNIPPPPK